MHFLLWYEGGVLVIPTPHPSGYVAASAVIDSIRPKRTRAEIRPLVTLGKLIETENKQRLIIMMDKALRTGQPQAIRLNTFKYPWCIGSPLTDSDY